MKIKTLKNILKVKKNRRNNSKIAIFFHHAIMGNHHEVSKQIIDRLKNSGLQNICDIFTHNSVNAVNKYEFPTLDLLRDFSRRCDGFYYILYLHTKGVSIPNKQSIVDWRESMLYFMVDRWKDCIIKLKDGYDTVGVHYIPNNTPHYQGNFWWATSDYIATLPEIHKTRLIEKQHTERHKCEMWLLDNNYAEIYCPYHHKINPYITNNPKENYVGIKFPPTPEIVTFVKEK
jgi:hypothetical protein